MSDTSSISSEEFTVLLDGGRPWGFTLQGGADFRSPLKIGKVSTNGRAEKCGLLNGDLINSINGVPTGQMKHHEAQRLIASSNITLELVCTKETHTFSPKSVTTAFDFTFPEVADSNGRSNTFGSKHLRQRSLDLNFQSRSSVTCKRAVVGNKIAGITVPPPPPKSSTRRISEPRLSAHVPPAPSTMEMFSTSKPENMTPHPEKEPALKVQIQVETAIPKAVAMSIAEPNTKLTPTNETVINSMLDFELENPLQSFVVSDKQERVDNEMTISASPVKDAVIIDCDVSSDTNESESDMIAEVVLPTKHSNVCNSNTTVNPEILKEKDQDWYRSLFQTMKKGVHEDTPDQKPVWERSPVPARRSSYEFQSKVSPNFKYKNTSYVAPVAQRRLSESSISSSSTRTRPLKQSSSGSSIEHHQKNDVVSGSSMGVVYQKNMKKYNQSRNYWKSIEKQASVERMELEAKGNSLRRTSSATSCGPPIVHSSDAHSEESINPEKRDSFFKEEVIDVFSSLITEENSLHNPIFATPSSETDSSDNMAAKLHPLLNDDRETDETVHDVNHKSELTVFTRIDASKLNNALGNAATLGAMSLEGADPLTLQVTALNINKTQFQEGKETTPKKKKSKPFKPPPGTKAKVKFDFKPSTEKELGLQKGVIVNLTEQVDDNWLKGEYQKQTGIFPVSFVQVLSPEECVALETNDLEDYSKIQLAKAKFDFVASSEKELSLSKGDVLTINKEKDENWFEASMGDSIGIVPKSYIEIINIQDELQ